MKTRKRVGVIDFESSGNMSDDEYIQSLRANLIRMITHAENERACFMPDSANFKLYDTFAQVGLDVLFPKQG